LVVELLRGGVELSVFFDISYDSIISVENLLLAWSEFLRGKRQRADVQEFQFNLMDNILDLHVDLRNKTYQHGGYEHFVVTDPKRRDIHKASVRDRLVHHAIYRMLYPYFDTKFISDSYSCRNQKGTHLAMSQFQSYARKVSKNYTKSCWVLKCDIRRFFASVDHEILLAILRREIKDEGIIELLESVIQSFNSGTLGKGLPLGNLTSQLLVNIYMNEFDQFIKHKLRMKYYIRYTDDFVFLNSDKIALTKILLYIEVFLQKRLLLELHPKKVSICTFASGVDFLGWVHFPHHRVLRAVTKRRIIKRLEDLELSESSIQSYLGLLSHGNAYKIKQEYKSVINRDCCRLSHLMVD